MDDKNRLEKVGENAGFEVLHVDLDSELDVATQKITDFNAEVERMGKAMAENPIAKLPKIKEFHRRATDIKAKIPATYLNLVDLTEYNRLTEEYMNLEKRLAFMANSADAKRRELENDHFKLTNSEKIKKFYYKNALEDFLARNKDHRMYYDAGVWENMPSLAQMIQENAELIADFLAPYEANYHGYGMIMIRDNAYCGDIKDGKPNGEGRMCYSGTKQVYEGEWKDGLRHGRGTLREGDKVLFDGDWKNDSFNKESPFNIYKVGMEKMEAARKEWDQSKATTLYTEAKINFSKIKDYKDAKTLIEECNSFIDAYYAQLQSERDRNQLFSIILGFSFFVLCPLVLLFPTFFSGFSAWPAMAYAFFLAVLAKQNPDNFSDGAKVFMTVMKVLFFAGSTLGYVALCPAVNFGSVLTAIFMAVLFIVPLAIKYFYSEPLDVFDAFALFAFTVVYGIIIPIVLPISIWHVLWVSPVAIAVLMVIRAFITAKEITAGDNTGVSLVATALWFSYAAALIGTYRFSVGMFFFILLVLVIHVVNCFIMMLTKASEY